MLPWHKEHTLSTMSEPGGLDMTTPPAWPKAIGITSIVWAGLGLTCGVCAIGGILVAPMALGPGPHMPEDMPPTMRFNGLMWVWTALGFLLSGVLLAAGIACVRRMNVGRVLHLVWAVFGVISGLGSVYLNWSNIEPMNQWVRENPGSPLAKGHNPASGWIGVGMALIFGLAWPLFILFWFGALGKRPEAGAPDRKVI